MPYSIEDSNCSGECLLKHIVSYQLKKMKTNLMQYLSHHSVVISVTELSG